mmetsp:Transcript_7769/g.12616  ORF Transcript_7769/g.12616 Transcript_7769/m.12616 type:complete len:251 (+) Transcript_7769:609-1361(+)
MGSADFAVQLRFWGPRIPGFTSFNVVWFGTADIFCGLSLHHLLCPIGQTICRVSASHWFCVDDMPNGIALGQSHGAIQGHHRRGICMGAGGHIPQQHSAWFEDAIAVLPDKLISLWFLTHRDHGHSHAFRPAVSELCAVQLPDSSRPPDDSRSQRGAVVSDCLLATCIPEHIPRMGLPHSRRRALDSPCHSLQLCVGIRLETAGADHRRVARERGRDIQESPRSSKRRQCTEPYFEKHHGGCWRMHRIVF